MAKAILFAACRSPLPHRPWGAPRACCSAIFLQFCTMSRSAACNSAYSLASSFCSRSEMWWNSSVYSVWSLAPAMSYQRPRCCLIAVLELPLSIAHSSVGHPKSRYRTLLGSVESTTVVADDMPYSTATVLPAGMSIPEWPPSARPARFLAQPRHVAPMRTRSLRLFWGKSPPVSLHQAQLHAELPRCLCRRSGIFQFLPRLIEVLPTSVSAPPSGSTVISRG